MLLQESVLDWKGTKAPILPLALNESNQKLLYEGNDYQVLGAYLVPIWVLNEINLNHRRYNDSLAEKIIRENKITPALDGHPDDDYSPIYSDVKAIGKNPVIKNGIFYAECYFVDEDYYKKAKRMIELGMGLGLSSSAYGELDEEGTVLVESFDLERYFDFVLDPSYSVFFNGDNELNTSKSSLDSRFESTTESVTTNIKDNTQVNEIKTIESIDENKENFLMAEREEKLAQIEDRSIISDIKSSLKEAKSLEGRDKLASLEKVKETFEELNDKTADKAVGLNEEVSTEIETVLSSLAELAEKGQGYDTVLKEKEATVTSLEEATKIIENMVSEGETLQKTNEILQKKLELAINEMDSSKVSFNKLKEMYSNKLAESNTLVEPDDYIALLKSNEGLEKKFDIACEELDKIKEDYNSKAVKESRKRVSLTDLRESTENTEAIEETVEEKIVEPVTIKTIKNTYAENVNRKFGNQTEVKSYFEDLKERFGEKITGYENKFLDCDTLSEAQNLFFTVKRQMQEGIADVHRRNIAGRFVEQTTLTEEERLPTPEFDGCKPCETWL